MSLDLRIFLVTATMFASLPLGASAGERFSFDDNWRFQKGEHPGAETPQFDDSAWRMLNLPHDWAIEGPFDKAYNARCGGLPFHGVAWYRKTFQLPEKLGEKQLFIEFDGAMANASVWINGWKLGEHPYGYTGFSFDMTPYLSQSGGNVLAVCLAPEDLSSRWYPGAGIYRHVWLEAKNLIHIARHGTYITTPKISDDQCTVKIQTQVENQSPLAAKLLLETIIQDAEGKEVARAESPFAVAANAITNVIHEATLSDAHRWDLDDPYRYTALNRIKNGDESLDQQECPFGARSIEYDAEQGFLLNGRSVKFKGVCLHHDLGPLGAAVNTRATERQLEIMKSMGVNAIRTSHNPPSPEQLEACDKLGLLAMAEAFDVWRLEKVPNGYNKYFDDWHESDLREMIRRDRNHPSVVMWSIGNEIREQGQPDGWQMARHLVGICHTEDPSRPVTAGFNIFPGCVNNGLADEVDLVGLNYKPAFYEEVLREHPNWVVYGSETASTVSTRGIYHLPLEAYATHESLQVTSYDIIAPPWAYPSDVEFHYEEQNPRIMGEFIWTGFDYLGEPTPYGGRDNSTNGYWNGDWPAHGSYFGAVDLSGFPKDRYYLYQSQWTETPMVHLLPHWNWEGREDESIPVFSYSNCEEVELFLNGKSLGRKKKGVDTVEIPAEFKGFQGKIFTSKYRLRWNVPFQPGTLKAVAYTGGKALCETEVRTAGAPAKLHLTPDRENINADGDDLSFVTVRVEDANGVFCPLADNLVAFKVSGAGEIAAVGNGNPISLEPFQANQRKAFNGLCLLIVRSTGQPGDITVIAESEGLKGQSIVLKAE